MVKNKIYSTQYEVLMKRMMIPGVTVNDLLKSGGDSNALREILHR